MSKTSVHSDGGAGLPGPALRDCSALRWRGAKARTAIGKAIGLATVGMTWEAIVGHGCASPFWGCDWFSSAKSFAANSRSRFTNSSNMSARAEKEMRNAFRVARRLATARRMILLPVAQDAMAVAADRDQCFIQFVEVAAGDVMKLKDQRFIDAAKRASRRVRTQPFQRPLLAALAVQFVIVHGQVPSNDDAVDVLEALVVRRGEPIERVGSGLEWVRPSGNVSDAHALELAEPGRIVGPEKVADGGHEAADFRRRCEVADHHLERLGRRKRAASGAATGAGRSIGVPGAR